MSQVTGRQKPPWWARLVIRVQVAWDEVRMWWRSRSGQYAVTRQWFNIGRDIAPEQAYDEVKRFVSHTVNLSPRPYGHGIYDLALAAVWPGEDDDYRSDRWQPPSFTYQERQAVFERLAEHMVAWEPPPLAIMVAVLPYGSLYTGRPVQPPQ